MRLDKFVSNNTEYSRSEVKKMFSLGLIKVNGEVVKKGDGHIDENKDDVTVSGNRIGFIENRYFMLNKPDGYISATKDDENKTVNSIFPKDHRDKIFSVGRLDIDTEGLLIMTDDGELGHKLTSPKKHVPKVYYAETEGKLSDDCFEQFEKGIDFKDFTSMPAKLEVITEGENPKVRVTIIEGKFHQVKRMLLKVGVEVKYLKREAIGELKLDGSLNPGEYRELTKEEIDYLKSL